MADLYQFITSIHTSLTCLNSLMKHIDEIRFILTSIALEVLAINETKLDSFINNGEIYIPGYVFMRKDRTSHGGGVLIYIKENLAYSNRGDLVPDRLEMICLEIKFTYIRPWSQPLSQ